MDVWKALEANHSKSNLGNFQHQYLAELLVNVYGYLLIVKRVSSVVCLKAGFSQIWSHLEDKTNIKVWVFGDIYPTKHMGKMPVKTSGQLS